ncbi:hypothetical protein H0H93_010394 [Arthromyces matolae]|nr:hypothetical protein H0H93_010394 [Arthromyces matolae]
MVRQTRVLDAMSTRKPSQNLTQGKLSFDSAKPKRTHTQNIKIQQQAKAAAIPLKKNKSREELVDVDGIEVPSSSEDEESSISSLDKKEAARKEPSKSTKTTTTEPSTRSLRQKVVPENQDLPELNPKNPKYSAHYAKVVKTRDYLPTIHSNGQGKIHEILRCFDMSYEYGPCVGVSRLERWERAHLLGLDPPKEVKDILTTKQGLQEKEFAQSVLYNEVYAFRKFGGFTSGIGICYQESSIVYARHQAVASGLVVGKRVPSQQLTRIADGRPFELQNLLPSDTRFKLLVFTGDLSNPIQNARVSKLAMDLMSKDSFLRRYSVGGDIFAAFDILSITANQNNIQCRDLPEFLRSHWSRAYVDKPTRNAGGDAYTNFNIQASGAVVLVRPDGYVGAIAPFDCIVDLDAYFEEFASS